MRKLLSIAIGLWTLALLGTSANAASSISITDISGSGPAGGYLPLSLFSGNFAGPIGDDTFVNTATPNFSWAGQTWSSIGIVSNGYVVVGGATSADVFFVPSPFPSLAAPNNVLAPFWADLDSSHAGSILVNTLTNGAGSSWIVVDFEQVPLFASGATTETFEIWIQYQGGNQITYSYGAMSTVGVNFGVGAEDPTGTVGANFLGTVQQGLELRVTSDGFETPLPAALPLFASGAGVLGFFGWRRKRKQVA